MAEQPTDQGDDAQRRTALETRIRGGYWPTSTEVAFLLGGISRYTVMEWMRRRQMRWKFRGGGRWRECHPGDVLARLDESRTVHGAHDDAPSPDDPE